MKVAFDRGQESNNNNNYNNIHTFLRVAKESPVALSLRVAHDQSWFSLVRLVLLNSPAFMHLYSIFNLRLFLSILFLIVFVNVVLKHQTKMVNGTMQHLFSLFAIFYKSNAEGTNFWIMFVCCTFM